MPDKVKEPKEQKPEMLSPENISKLPIKRLGHIIDEDPEDTEKKQKFKNLQEVLKKIEKRK